MGFLWLILIGFIVGLLARFLKPGEDNMGFILTTLLGIAGALIAGIIGRATGIYDPGETVGFIASVLGAIFLLVIVDVIRRRSHKSVTR